MKKIYIFKLFSSGQIDWIYRPYPATFNDSQLGEQAHALKEKLSLEGRNEGWKVFSTASRHLYWSGFLLYGYRRERADRYIFLAKKFQFKLGLDPPACQKRFNLTKREGEVLNLYFQGWTEREIALRNQCQTSTITWYLKSIMRKVGVKKRRQLLQATLPCIQPVETDENHPKG